MIPGQAPCFDQPLTEVDSEIHEGGFQYWRKFERQARKKK